MFYELARDYRMRMYHIALNTESGTSLPEGFTTCNALTEYSISVTGSSTRPPRLYDTSLR